MDVLNKVMSLQSLNGVLKFINQTVLVTPKRDLK